MGSRMARVAWLAASLMLAACSLHHNGLGAGVEEADDGGGLVGAPGAGGSPSGGSGGAATGGSVGTGGAATGGSPGTGGAIGTGGAPVVDAAPPPPDLAPPPPDVVVVSPPPPLPPDAAPLPPDASPLPPDAAPLPRDTAPPPPPATISCGASKCLAGSQACCVTAAGASCIPINGLCLGGSAFRCDGPEDCDNGRVCCLRMEGGGYRSACARAPECAQSAGAAICRSGADCPALARTCTPVSGSTISVCR